MSNNQILDESFIKKRFKGQWLGATYFVFGIGIWLGIMIPNFGLQLLLKNHTDLNSIYWDAPAVLAGLVFFFCNIVGFIMSITYIVSGKTGRAKIAGWLCLLLNLLPYIAILLLYLSSL